jgi:hypothetical protein
MRMRVDDLMVTTLTKAEPAVLDFEEILEATRVMPDDCSAPQGSTFILRTGTHAERTWLYAPSFTYLRFKMKRPQNKLNSKERLFIGVYPGGIVYADRSIEVQGDYKRLAFLPYHSLLLEWASNDCPSDVRHIIENDAAKIVAMRGQYYPVSASGQTVLLGA